MIGKYLTKNWEKCYNRIEFRQNQTHDLTDTDRVSYPLGYGETHRSKAIF